MPVVASGSGVARTEMPSLLKGDVLTLTLVLALILTLTLFLTPHPELRH